MLIYTLVSNVTDVLWCIGCPIAFAKAALVLYGLGFLVWFVVLRRPGSNEH